MDNTNGRRINWCGKIINAILSKKVCPEYLSREPLSDTEFRLKNAKDQKEIESILWEDDNKKVQQTKTDFRNPSIFQEETHLIIEGDDSFKIATQLSPIIEEISFPEEGMDDEGEIFEFDHFYINSDSPIACPIKDEEGVYNYINIDLKVRNRDNLNSFSLMLNPDSKDLCSIGYMGPNNTYQRALKGIAKVDNTRVSVAIEEFLIKLLGMPYVEMRRDIYKKEIKRLKFDIIAKESEINLLEYPDKYAPKELAEDDAEEDNRLLQQLEEYHLSEAGASKTDQKIAILEHEKNIANNNYNYYSYLLYDRMENTASMCLPDYREMETEYSYRGNKKRR